MFFLYFMSSSAWRDTFSCLANLSTAPFSPSALTSVCLSPASPTEGGLSVHPILSTAFLPRYHRPSPICLSALRPLSWGCTLSLPPPLSLPASLSLMRRDRYGRRGRGGTCLSKPAVENEGSDEGGMLCILNAQTPVRGRGVGGGGGGGGEFGVGKYQ